MSSFTPPTEPQEYLVADLIARKVVEQLRNLLPSKEMLRTIIPAMAMEALLAGFLKQLSDKDHVKITDDVRELMHEYIRDFGEK